MIIDKFLPFGFTLSLGRILASEVLLGFGMLLYELFYKVSLLPLGFGFIRTLLSEVDACTTDEALILRVAQFPFQEE